MWVDALVHRRLYSLLLKGQNQAPARPPAPRALDRDIKRNAASLLVASETAIGCHRITTNCAPGKAACKNWGRGLAAFLGSTRDEVSSRYEQASKPNSPAPPWWNVGGYTDRKTCSSSSTALLL